MRLLTPAYGGPGPETTQDTRSQALPEREPRRSALVATRGDDVDLLEARPRRARPPQRAPRVWLLWLGVVLTVGLLWLAWSVGGALAAPGTDTTAAKLAEWGRGHGLGPVVTYLEQLQYQVNPPKVGGSPTGGIPRLAQNGSTAPLSRPATYLPPPDTIPAQIQPALSGEGDWQPLVRLKKQPAIEAAFLRPDTKHTSYLVGVAWVNQKLVKLALHPGYTVPGTSGLSAPTDVPKAQRDHLVATFNSGFRMKDANGGYWQNGTSVVPLRSGAASMVFYRDGHLDVVRWGSAKPGAGVVAVRQNLALLVNNGVVNQEVDTTSKATWGRTIGNKTYVWRSAVGVRQDGSLVFVVGAAMSVRTLANIVHDAGAVRAMELDINPDWTNFMTYTHPHPGLAVPHLLTKDEKPDPYRYLQSSSRDFVAVIARP